MTDVDTKAYAKTMHMSTTSKMVFTPTGRGGWSGHSLVLTLVQGARGTGYATLIGAPSDCDRIVEVPIDVLREVVRIFDSLPSVPENQRAEP